MIASHPVRAVAALGLTLVTLLMPQSARAQRRALPPQAEPTALVAPSLALMDAGKLKEGCSDLFATLEDPVLDPWAYRGAARCALELEGYRERLEALAAKGADPALHSLGRGLLAFYQLDLDSAEGHLREAVRARPDLALAWNALGAVAARQGDAAYARSLVEKALALEPALELAHANLARIDILDGADARLIGLFTGLPGRLGALGEPVESADWLGPSEALDKATQEEVDRAGRRLFQLMGTPLAQRDAWLNQTYEAEGYLDIDAWYAYFKRPTGDGWEDPQTILFYEAWGQIASRLGRVDALLVWAHSVYVLEATRIPNASLIKALEAWLTLASSRSAARGELLSDYGDRLSLDDALEEAERAYKEACVLMERFDDQIGLGVCKSDLGGLYFKQRRWEDALSAYRNAHEILAQTEFIDAAAQAWDMEGSILSLMGDPAGAAQARREAIRLRGEGEDRVEKADALIELAGDLLANGELEAALDKARAGEVLLEQLAAEPGVDLWRWFIARRSLGAFYVHAGDAPRAIDHLKVCLRVFPNIADPSMDLADRAFDLYITRMYLSLAYGEDDRPVEAADAATAAADTATSIGDFSNAFEASSRAAELYAQGEDLKAAEEALDEMATVITHLDGHMPTYEFAKLRGIVASASGEDEQALIDLDQAAAALERAFSAAEVHRTPSPTQPVTIHQHRGALMEARGQALARLGRDEQALAAYQGALDHNRLYLKEPGAQPRYALDVMAQLLIKQGDLLQNLGRVQEAGTAYGEAGEIALTRGDARAAAKASIGMGEVALSLGDEGEAFTRFDEAEALYRGAQSAGGVINAMVEKGEALRSLGQASKAQEAYEGALQLLEQSTDAFVRSSAWDSYGDFLLQTDRPEDALRAYESALDACASATCAINQVSSHIGRARARFLLGEVAESFTEVERALALQPEGAVSNNLGNTLMVRAELHEKAGDRDGALSDILAAEAVYRRLYQPLGLGNSLVHRAALLTDLGERAQARALLDEAELVLGSIHNRLGLGNVWEQRSEIDMLEMRYHEALHAIRSARALYEEPPVAANLGQTWLDEADLLWRAGDWVGAAKALDEAARLAEGARALLLQANVLRYSADMLETFGRPELALEALKEMANVASRSGVPLTLGTALKAQGDTYRSLGRLADAARLYDEAEPHIVKGGGGLALANLREAQARLAADMNDREGAIGPLRQAIEIFRALGLKGNLLTALGLEARLREGMDEPAKALAISEEILALSEGLHRVGLDDLHGILLIEDEDILAAQDRVIEALAMNREAAARLLVRTDRVRSPVFHEALARRADPSWGPPSPEMLTESETLYQALRGVERALELESDLSNVGALKAEQVELEARLRWSDYRMISGGRRDSPPATSQLDSEVLLTVAKRHGPILSFYVGRSETLALLLLPDRQTPVVAHIPISRETLATQARSLRRDLLTPGLEGQALKGLTALGDQLFGELSELLRPQEHLVIIPHGPLHQLPWALLGEGHLPEALVSAPSLRFLAVLRDAEVPDSGHPSSALITVGPRIDGEGERAAIETHLAPGALTVLEGPNATFEAYRAVAETQVVIHLATLGLYEPGGLDLAYLELAPSEGFDRHLRASQLTTLAHHAELVTIAACDTAAAVPLSSDERLDISSAFLLSGARSVLGTAWKVPEGGQTDRFLALFYEALGERWREGASMPLAQALADARSRARDAGMSPIVWASFVLIGGG